MCNALETLNRISDNSIPTQIFSALHDHFDRAREQNMLSRQNHKTTECNNDKTFTRI